MSTSDWVEKTRLAWTERVKDGWLEKLKDGWHRDGIKRRLKAAFRRKKRPSRVILRDESDSLPKPRPHN